MRKPRRRTAHALSIDNCRIAENHVTCALFVKLGDSRSDGLENKDCTVCETRYGALCQVLDDIGDMIGLDSEKVVDFL